jgi:hypothetical protein
MPIYLHPLNSNGIVAQLDRASHYGCEGLGFESLQCHQEATKSPTKVGGFWFKGVTHSYSHPVSPTHSDFHFPNPRIHLIFGDYVRQKKHIIIGD